MRPLLYMDVITTAESSFLETLRKAKFVQEIVGKFTVFNYERETTFGLS